MSRDRRDRARITIPGVMFFLVAIAYLGALWPVVDEQLNLHVGKLTVGEAYIYQLFLPFLILVILYIFYVEAVVGR